MHGRAFASRRSAFPRNPSRFPECRDTIKGFAFSIRFLHGSCNNIKRVRASVASPYPFAIPSRLFFASIFAPLSADCESSAYIVSAFG